MTYDRSLWLKSYDPGVGPEVQIEHDSLPACFEYIRRQRGDKPAVHYLGVTFTFDQLLGHADRFARCLADHGIGKGDAVAICLPNSPQYLIALIGALKAGAAASGLSPLHSAKEMAYQLKDSGAKAFVVMDAIFEHRFMGVADQAPDLQLVVPTGLLDFLPKIKQLLAKWLKKVPTGRTLPVPGKTVVPLMEVLSRFPAQPPDVGLTRDDPCFIQYTGGTTGLPKGALCVHRNMLTNVKQWLDWLQVDDNQDQTILSAFPMFHIAGLFTALCGLTFGLPQVVIPNPRDTKLIVREIAKYRPQWLANVPSLYLMLLQEPGFHKLDFSDLLFCISGAAPFSVEGIKQFENVVGEGKVIEVYGMTETCVLVTANPRLGTKKIGSVGLPLPSTKVKIVDLASGEQEVPLGEVGEIIATGPQIMREYHNRPGETSQVMRMHDGEVWMHTGDLGTMDEDGYVTIVDRAKDMISVSGYKVFPREVEEKLYEHPAIDLCAVIGVQNPERPETEMVKLVVQKSAAYQDKADGEVSKDIIAFSRENFASYKVPKIIEYREIPLTPAGKVDKKALK
jgi:acyl-CoA synthetase (AMP-forming)/AMP-acid ligase II